MREFSAQNMFDFELASYVIKALSTLEAKVIKCHEQ